MQLTRFDRWLRERFVYETLIYTMRPLPKMPRGVKKKRYTPVRGARYLHLYSPKNERAQQRFIALLNAEGLLFSTQVAERKVWYASLFAPKGKSVTWWLISTVLFLSFLFVVFRYLYHLWADPEIRKYLIESVEILRG